MNRHEMRHGRGRKDAGTLCYLRNRVFRRGIFPFSGWGAAFLDFATTCFVPIGPVLSLGGQEIKKPGVEFVRLPAALGVELQQLWLESRHDIIGVLVL